MNTLRDILRKVVTTDLGNDLGNSLSTVIAPKISTHHYHLSLKIDSNPKKISN